MAETETLASVWKKFRELVNTKRGNPGNADNPPSKEEVQELRKQFNKVERLANAATAISSFFEAVGDGVVKAQQLLDTRSNDYNNPKSLPKPELPTLFRIPQVKAELHFGITSVSSEGINIFIAQKKDEMTETMEQTISFEIIGVPPPLSPKSGLPPEAGTEAFASLINGDGGAAGRKLPTALVTEPQERQAVLAKLQEASGTEVSALLSKNQNRIVMLEVGEGYLVVFVETDDDGVTPWRIHLFGVKGNEVTAEPMKGKLSSPAMLIGEYMIRLANLQQRVLE